jgi:hypothetical protein
MTAMPRGVQMVQYGLDGMKIPGHRRRIEGGRSAPPSSLGVQWQGCASASGVPSNGVFLGSNWREV